MPLSENKDLKLYYSISEVAKMFNVSETLLRFWEKQFPQIKPRKSGRNIRQYSRDDIEQVRLIYNLVKVRGLKLAAARDALNKNHSGEQQTTEVIEKLKNIYNDGHEIGNHSYIHPNFMNITEERMNDELKKTEEPRPHRAHSNTQPDIFPPQGIPLGVHDTRFHKNETRKFLNTFLYGAHLTNPQTFRLLISFSLFSQ